MSSSSDCPYRDVQGPVCRQQSAFESGSSPENLVAILLAGLGVVLGVRRVNCVESHPVGCSKRDHISALVFDSNGCVCTVSSKCASYCPVFPRQMGSSIPLQKLAISPLYFCLYERDLLSSRPKMWSLRRDSTTDDVSSPLAFFEPRHSERARLFYSCHHGI